MSVLRWFNARAGRVFLIGVVVVLMRNLLRWQHDKAMLHQFHSQRSEMPELHHHPRVSVLVAAWNEAETIQHHIQSFQRLRYPNKELILCAGGDDGTYEKVFECLDRSNSMMVLEQQPGEGKQRALRRNFAAASGEIIFLTDADCLLDDAQFERTLAPVINREAVVATGRYQPLDSQMRNSFVLHRWYIDLYSEAQWGAYTQGLVGANSAIRQDALQAVGGFAADVNTGTDYHMAKLLTAHGYRIRYVRESSVPTTYSETLAHYHRRQMRWLRNVVMHGMRFGERREVLQALLPAFIGWGMLVGPFVGLLLGPIVIVPFGLMWLHVLISRVRYMHFGELLTHHVLGWGYIWLPYYIVVDFVIWALTLLQYPFRRWRRQW